MNRSSSSAPGRSAAREGIMARLRAETRDAHRAIEQTALARSMATGTMSQSAYVLQLRGYAAIHRVLEHQLDASASPTVAAVWRKDMSRLRWVESDLAGLASVQVVWSPGLDDAVRRLCAELTSAGRSAAILGPLYVLEGSSLGAALLWPRMQAGMGLRDDQLAYYRGHGPGGRACWQALSARMDEAVSATDEDAVIEAARCTFSQLSAVFEAIGPALRAAA